jgi:hypothetical protein
MINRAEEAEYPYPLEQVYEATIAGVRAAKSMKVKKEDPASHRIEVSTGVSATSWGDRVVITFAPVSATVTRVHVSSAPKTGAMLGGWMSGGHQAKNVSEIFAVISDQFEHTKSYKNESEYQKDAHGMRVAGWEAAGEPVPDRKSKHLMVRWIKHRPIPAAAPDSQPEDIAAKLRQLADLKAVGILSEEEFNAKKTELLARL